MNTIHNKIGLKEASWSVTICGISPFLLVLTGYCSNRFMSGALIGFTLCFVVSLAVFYLSKKAYSKVCCEQSYSEFLTAVFGKFLGDFILFALVALFFVQNVLGFSLYIASVERLVSGEISASVIKFLLVLTIVICTFYGNEAVTRQGYVSAMLVVLLVILMCYSASEGVNADNLYPIFGKTTISSFFNPIYMIMYAVYVPVWLVSDMFNEREAIAKCAKRSLIYVFVISFVLMLLYVLTVPYPMGERYGNSIEAIFFCIGSGEIIHRFEIFLLILYLLCAIQASAFAVCVCSEKLSYVTRLNDRRPYIILLSAIMYFMVDYGFSEYIYLLLTVILAAVSILLPFLAVGIKRFSGVKKGE